MWSISFWLNVALVLAAVGILIATLARLRIALSTILALQLFPALIGAILLYRSGVVPFRTGAVYIAGVAAFVIGLWIANKFRRQRHSPAPNDAELELQNNSVTLLTNAAVWTVVIFASSLSLYHLAVGGIPILSTNVERARFDFTSSGLFGLPGRMYLYGTKISWILATVWAAHRQIRLRKSGPWVVATTILIATTLASGFKGQALSTFVLMLAVTSFISTRRITFAGAFGRYWPAVAAGLFYFGLTANTYATYSNGSDGIATRAIERATVTAAEPPAIAISFGSQVSPWLNDLQYYAERYFSIGNSPGYSFERAVSASIIGANPLRAEYLTPVNVGALAEFVASLGVVVGLAAYGSLAFSLVRLEQANFASPIAATIACIASYMGYTFVLKGGLIYQIINWALVAALLLAVGSIARLLLGPEPGTFGARLASAQRFNT